MTKDEIAKNIANRFVHSGTYIILYLAMAGLSITTVVLSLVNDCPTLPFYILEFIINGAMILEVGIRFVAFGRVSATVSSIKCASSNLFPSAILEVHVERHGSGHDRVLRDHPPLHLLRRMREHEQGGRAARYSTPCWAERSPVWKARDGDATVRHSTFRLSRHSVSISLPDETGDMHKISHPRTGVRPLSEAGNGQVVHNLLR